MIKKSEILNNKEYIIELNKQRVFFKFPDGSQDHADKPETKIIHELLQYFSSEEIFYERMLEELNRESSKRRKNYNSKHYYTEEEIKEVEKLRGEHLFRDYEMEYHNEQMREENLKIVGINEVSSKILDKRWKLHKLVNQCKNTLKEV